VPDAIIADALSTAVSIMCAEKRLAIIEALLNIVAVVITNDSRSLKSSWAQRYMK
jgi:thiamine biosynthesis lipoprotein ApbE